MLERLVPGALEKSSWAKTTSHWASETAGSCLVSFQQSNNRAFLSCFSHTFSQKTGKVIIKNNKTKKISICVLLECWNDWFLEPWKKVPGSKRRVTGQVKRLGPVWCHSNNPTTEPHTPLHGICTQARFARPSRKNQKENHHIMACPTRFRRAVYPHANATFSPRPCSMPFWNNECSYLSHKWKYPMGRGSQTPHKKNVPLSLMKKISIWTILGV